MRNNLDKNLEQNAPLENFNDIIAILSARHLSASKKPTTAVQPEESKGEKIVEAPYFVLKGEEENYIYTELIPTASKGLTSHGRTQNTNFTDLVRSCISNLFDLLIVEMRQYTPTCIHLIHALTPHFFAMNRPFYMNHFLKELKSSTYMTGYAS